MDPPPDEQNIRFGSDESDSETESASGSSSNSSDDDAATVIFVPRSAEAADVNGVQREPVQPATMDPRAGGVGSWAAELEEIRLQAMSLDVEEELSDDRDSPAEQEEGQSAPEIAVEADDVAESPPPKPEELPEPADIPKPQLHIETDAEFEEPPPSPPDLALEDEHAQLKDRFVADLLDLQTAEQPLTSTPSPASSASSPPSTPAAEPLLVPDYDSDAEFKVMMNYLEGALARDLQAEAEPAKNENVEAFAEHLADEESRADEAKAAPGAQEPQPNSTGRLPSEQNDIDDLAASFVGLSVDTSTPIEDDVIQPASPTLEAPPVTGTEDQATAGEIETEKVSPIDSTMEDSKVDNTAEIHAQAATPESEDLPAPPTEPELARFTIFEAPAPEIILHALQCRVCGQVRPPPYYQCEAGHLICEKDAAQLEGINIWKKAESVCSGGSGSNGETKTRKKKKLEVAEAGSSSSSSPYSTPSPKLPGFLITLIFPKCPVEVQNGVALSALCGAIVIKGTLNLYNDLYAACEMNCPRMELGCGVKMLGADLKKHLREECFYNVLVKCQNSYCSAPVQQCEYLKHQREAHQIHFYNGTRNSIAVWHERLKYAQQLYKTTNGTLGYDWIAAVLDFDCEHFVFRVHEQQDSFLFWVQQIRTKPTNEEPNGAKETPPQTEYVTPEDEADRLRKLLGIGIAAPAVVNGKRESPDPQGKQKVYWSQFFIRNPKTGASHKWMGPVASPGCATSKLIDSQEYFQLYKTCMEKKYLRGPGYTFEIQLELKVQMKNVR